MTLTNPLKTLSIMTDIGNLPDIGNSARLLKLSVELEHYRYNDLVGLQIQEGLQPGKLKPLIKELKEAIKDCPEMYKRVLGKDLVNDILNVQI